MIPEYREIPATHGSARETFLRAHCADSGKRVGQCARGKIA